MKATEIFKGKNHWTVTTDDPHWSNKTHRCVKSWKLQVPFTSLKCWIAVINDDATAFSDKAMQKLYKVFDLVDNSSLTAYKGKTPYYLSDALWIVRDIEKMQTTKEPQIMFDKDEQKYIGFSHRGRCAFGIGDMLFDPDSREDLDSYYRNKKFRWKFIKTLLKYHFKNDAMAFEDLCEDTIISHGVTSVIPFRKRGRKTIENLDEAFEAALNFAKYLS